MRFSLVKTGLNIRSRRVLAGMLQDELAERLGVNKTSVGNWERGQVSPSIKSVVDMADLFSCSVDELVGRDDRE